MGHTLTKERVARLYDRIGILQDTQRFYEDPAVKVLVRESALNEASHVIEAGCGTGRLARHLLRDVLPPRCTYVGIDISPMMVGLARARVADWSDRANVQVGDATTFQPNPSSADRFITAYCVDLMSEVDILGLLKAARNALTGTGLLCAVGLAGGQGPVERVISALWKGVHRVAPQLLGGCRPIHLCESLVESEWRIVHHDVVCAFGLCSEVLVAQPLTTATPLPEAARSRGGVAFSDTKSISAM